MIYLKLSTRQLIEIGDTVPRYKMQMPSPYPNLHTFPVTIKGSYSDCPIPASFLYSLIQRQQFWERFMVWRCRHQSVNV
jgi:hypothetical protein